MGIRSLFPGLADEADKLRSFRLEKTSYSLEDDVLTPSPEGKIDSLDLLLAQESIDRLQS